MNRTIHLVRNSLFLIFIIFISMTGVIFPAFRGIHIRINQLGYLPGDLKTGVVISGENIKERKFAVFNSSNKKVLTGNLISAGSFSEKFPFAYTLDFSRLAAPGKYIIEIDKVRSHSFSIGKNLYNGITDSLLKFFRVQRCGYTDPILHQVCHPDDASALIFPGNKRENRKTDLTGGWHDAGDYIKFLNTTAFATYMLLFSYDFDPVKFNSDKNKNSVPDILEEAKIGLDWLLRANYEGVKLISQVQDMRDHEVGWRMPEADQFLSDRPAFTGAGKNLAGIYSATLALASVIWRDKIRYPEFADKCLSAAKRIYSAAGNMPDIDKSGSGMYQDSKYQGKLALAAVELYRATWEGNYLESARELASQAKSDFWWSWGDINSLAHYRLSKYDGRFKDYIYNNLKHFNDQKNRKLFGNAAENSWGSNNALLGIALQAILWKKLTGSSAFDSLAVIQRDFILGRNQWGVSFIHRVGTVYSKNFHSQVAYFNKGYLPGAVAAGPIGRKNLEGYKISFEGNDRFRDFQTEDAVYRDDRMDYVTNEPTITANATAIFVFGYYSGK